MKKRRRAICRSRRLYLSWPQRLVRHKLVMANGAPVTLNAAEMRSAQILFRNRIAMPAKGGARLAASRIATFEWRVTVDWAGLDWAFRDLLAKRLPRSSGSGFFFVTSRYDMDWHRATKAEANTLAGQIRAVAKASHKRVRVRLDAPLTLEEMNPPPTKDRRRYRRSARGPKRRYPRTSRKFTVHPRKMAARAR